MNEQSHHVHGKIAVHGNGLGAPTPEIIEKRAREIALIAERDPNNFTDADWDQARRELRGVASDTAPEETEQSHELVEEWEVVPSTSAGQRAPRSTEEDEDHSVGEQLVSGGLEEAAHDQMVEARREELQQEGGS